MGVGRLMDDNSNTDLGMKRTLYSLHYYNVLFEDMFDLNFAFNGFSFFNNYNKTKILACTSFY